MAAFGRVTCTWRARGSAATTLCECLARPATRALAAAGASKAVVDSPRMREGWLSGGCTHTVVRRARVRGLGLRSKAITTAESSCLARCTSTYMQVGAAGASHLADGAGEADWSQALPTASHGAIPPPTSCGAIPRSMIIPLHVVSGPASAPLTREQLAATKPPPLASPHRSPPPPLRSCGRLPACRLQAFMGQPVGGETSRRRQLGSQPRASHAATAGAAATTTTIRQRG